MRHLPHNQSSRVRNPFRSLFALRRLRVEPWTPDGTTRTQPEQSRLSRRGACLVAVVTAALTWLGVQDVRGVENGVQASTPAPVAMQRADIIDDILDIIDDLIGGGGE